MIRRIIHNKQADHLEQARQLQKWSAADYDAARLAFAKFLIEECSARDVISLQNAAAYTSARMREHLLAALPSNDAHRLGYLKKLREGA